MGYFRTCLLLLFLGIAVWSSLADQLFAENRSFDGTGNNLANPEWGSAGSNFGRMAPVAYDDLISVPRFTGLPNPRSVSIELFQQQESIPNKRKLSGFVYAFGQLLSHDMQHSQTGGEPFGFVIPSNDDMFFPGQTFPLTRSLFDEQTGTNVDNPREQSNFTTAFIDASVVYGASEREASVLRGGPANPGARLRTSNDINGDEENMLPRDAFGPNLEAEFVAGDSRANDNVVLSSLHTLFMREHNRLVGEIEIEHPDWNAEQVYQRARKVVGALFQAITYNEFLPALMGPHAPSTTGTYNSSLDPTIFNEFPAVFLRIGHSMLNNHFLRIENDGQWAPGGPINLETAFFNPAALPDSREVDLLLKGLSVEIQEETDLQLVFGMRVALLGATDIQRARDHGLPDYNTMREAYGLPRVTSFSQISADEIVQTGLENMYGDVDSIDAFVGALAEDHLPGASLGPLTAAAYFAQFTRARDGDRFWYEHDSEFTSEQVDELRATTLADIIRRNTGVTDIQDNVFFSSIPEPGSLTLLIGAMLSVTSRRSR